MTRDQAKKERLEQQLGGFSRENMMQAAKAKAVPPSRVKGREMDEVENMEWRYVTT